MAKYVDGFVFVVPKNKIAECKKMDGMKPLAFTEMAEQCGWLKDKYGLSWQIVPTVMDEMMKDKDKKRLAQKRSSK